MGKIELALILKRPKTAQNHTSRPGFTCEHTCEWTGLDASNQTPKGVDYTLTAVSIKKNRPNSTNQRRQSLKVEFSLFHPVPNPAHTISCSPPHPFKLTPNLTPFHAMDVMISHPPYSTFYTAETRAHRLARRAPKYARFDVTTRFSSKLHHSRPN